MTTPIPFLESTGYLSLITSIREDRFSKLSVTFNLTALTTNDTAESILHEPVTITGDRLSLEEYHSGSCTDTYRFKVYWIDLVTLLDNVRLLVTYDRLSKSYSGHRTVYTTSCFY
ncbi:hypothetical protein [Rufibacter immobilis]|uniref:hypothetical protein n=1 Tax=Rufibacter immobilis TaxID=1348778 RepID=UPI0011CDA161|nr:hypothetical protein [Rufibacter immobilis]